jgi:hypothetical protein
VMPVIESDEVEDQAAAPLVRVQAPRPPQERTERYEDRRRDQPRTERGTTPPRADQRPEPVAESRSEQRPEPSREQRYRSSYPGQHERIVGMGDHVPDFIMRSFRVPEATPDDEEGENSAA